MTNIRVAFLASEYPPYVYGGLGTHVTELAAALAARGARIQLVVPEREAYQAPPTRVELRLVPVQGARSNEHAWLQFSERATDLADQLRGTVDLVHCHDWMTALAGVRLRYLLDVPLVFSVHLPQTASANVFMESLGLLWADLVLANGRAVTRELAQRGIPVKAMRVIPNGVHLHRFVPAATPRPDRYILFVGRLVDQKGVDIAVRGFSVLQQRCPDLRLVVVGDGDQALFLQRLARQEGISTHISFVGWQTGQALIDLYQGAAVVVVPSLYEPFGIVALEAMACARPVVASRTGGLAEVVQDGTTGYLVRPGDHLELAQRVVSLILEPEHAAELGRAGRRRALQFGWDGIAQRTEQAYRGVLCDERSAPLGDPSAAVTDLLGALDPPSREIAERLVSELAGGASS